MTTTIKIIRNERGVPLGKLADAELHFTGGELDGLKLIGFGVWERRITDRDAQKDGYRMYHLNVTFPARSFTVHGDRRNFALVRAIENPGARTVCGSSCCRHTWRRSASQRTQRLRRTNCHRAPGVRRNGSWGRSTGEASHVARWCTQGAEITPLSAWCREP